MEGVPRCPGFVSNPPFISHLGFLEGEQLQLEDLRTIWLFEALTSPGMTQLGIDYIFLNGCGFGTVKTIYCFSTGLFQQQFLGRLFF